MSEKTETESPADPASGAAPAAAEERRFGRLSLRVRLLLLVVVATMPAIVASTITAFTRYDAGLTETRANLRALSILAVNRHLETLAETNRLLQRLSRSIRDAVRWSLRACMLS